jgi:hypothetical protein
VNGNEQSFQSFSWWEEKYEKKIVEEVYFALARKQIRSPHEIK